MKLNLFEDKQITEEHVDVHYANMRPMIRQLIDVVNSERPSLIGRPADEDLDDGEGVYRIMKTLAECEELLWNYGFVRVSKSDVINVFKIRQLKPDFNMKVYAYFDNGERICVNRSYKKEFDEYLQRIRRIQ